MQFSEQLGKSQRTEKKNLCGPNLVGTGALTMGQGPASQPPPDPTGPRPMGELPTAPPVQPAVHQIRPVNVFFQILRI